MKKFVMQGTNYFVRAILLSLSSQFSFCSIEVKNARVLQPIDYNGLISFGDDYPEALLILLNRGNIPYKHKNFLLLSADTFYETTNFLYHQLKM